MKKSSFILLLALLNNSEKNRNCRRAAFNRVDFFAFLFLMKQALEAINQPT